VVCGSGLLISSAVDSPLTEPSNEDQLRKGISVACYRLIYRLVVRGFLQRIKARARGEAAIYQQRIEQQARPALIAIAERLRDNAMCVKKGGTHHHLVCLQCWISQRSGAFNERCGFGKGVDQSIEDLTRSRHRQIAQRDIR